MSFIREDIAIIGMAGRFPDAKNIEELYENLKIGKDSVKKISKERIINTTLPPNKEYRVYGYLDDIDKFDHELFNISYAEAQTMEPNQRLLLEVVYEIVNNSGYSLESLKNSLTSVYVTESSNNYHKLADNITPTLITGNAKEFLASRIAREFKLLGNNVMINTSCSSSFAAIHYACNELLINEADCALVCSVNIDIFPFKDDSLTLGLLSSDGKSRAFSDNANGMSRGELVAGVLLKPLKKAIIDSDVIHAVIKGSAINNNSYRSSSLSSPDSKSLSEVMIKAWTNSKINPEKIGFIEAHGSGTQLGDTLEIEGMDLAFRKFTQKTKFCPISTIKSNIGHGVFAAGMAGLFKSILSLKNKVLFPNIHSQNLNPLIDFNNSAIYVNNELREWIIDENETRIAGVNSIGFSGTNCHIVLEEFKNNNIRTLFNEENVFVFSSKTVEGLKENLIAFDNFLNKQTQVPDLYNISYTLTTGRMHYKFRTAIISDKWDDFRKKIKNEIAKKQIFQSKPKIIFILSDSYYIDEKLINITRRYFDDFNNSYKQCEKYFNSKSNEHNQIFAFQYSSLILLNKLGIKTESIISLGIGEFIINAFENKTSLKTAFMNIQNYSPSRIENIDKRINSLIEQEVDSNTLFIDLGIVSELSKELLKVNNDFVQVLTLDGNNDIRNPLLLILLKFYKFGIDLDWSLLFKKKDIRKIELPAYQFQRKRCWIRENTFNENRDTVNITENNFGVIEEKIFKIWNEQLEIDVITNDDDYFEIGGNSLKATEVIKKLNIELKIDLDFEDIFDFPNIKSLSDYIISKLEIVKIIELIWKNVLKEDNIKPNSNFFSLGGHSLIASQIINKIKSELQVEIDFDEFFKNPTIESQGVLVQSKIKENSIKEKLLIKKAEKKEYYELSASQKRMYYMQHLFNKSTSYNEFQGFKIKGDISQRKLNQIFNRIINDHEILRTSFHIINGEPKQIIHDNVSFSVNVYNSNNHNIEKVLLDINKVFDLTEAPLLRVGLFQLTADESIFIVNMHHIITDRTSGEILKNDFVNHYLNRNMKVLKYQYKDYSEWHSAFLKSKKMIIQKEFWKSLYKKPIEKIKFEKELNNYVCNKENKLNFDIPSDIVSEIKKYCAQEEITPFIFFLTLYNLLIRKISAKNDIIIGIPALGRTREEFYNIIGMFINSLPIRTTFTINISISSLFRNVKNVVFNAYKNQDYQIENLKDDLIGEDIKLMDIINIFFQLSTIESCFESKMQEKIDDIYIEPFELPNNTSKFDLYLFGIEEEEKYKFFFEYNNEIFSKETIINLKSHYIGLIDQIINEKFLYVNDLKFNVKLSTGKTDTIQNDIGNFEFN